MPQHESLSRTPSPKGEPRLEAHNSPVVQRFAEMEDKYEKLKDRSQKYVEDLLEQLQRKNNAPCEHCQRTQELQEEKESQFDDIRAYVQQPLTLCRCLREVFVFVGSWSRASAPSSG